ncbi:MAG: MFS transporter [Euryarchaeota archaeon]|uniref:Permease of the major facilitator superfamily n=1 Tax=uncultured euryarchaeote Alv-FOS4 TaxID=337893 RepID=Q3SA88_9EURY|nr:permease of the major facilitator superfamily [uncultured euryarchaeote Alv-FOS4]NPA75747.1 MFS transporter [Euryarchaeota archaeon]
MHEEIYDLKYAKRAMAVFVLLPLLVMYTEAVLIPSLPTIQKDFGITPGDASWILSMYLLVGTVSVAVMGKLGDMFGKRRMFLIALTFYTAGVTMNGFAPTYQWLLFSRGLQGVGMSIFPLGFSLVREEFPPEMVPEVQGLISAMFAVGMVIALPLGAYISQNYGWRWTYHSVVPFAIMMFIAAFIIIRESRYVTRTKFDFPGALLLILFVVPALVAVTRAPTIGWEDKQTITLFVISAISFIALFLWERRAESPLIPISVISARNPMLANIGIMMAGFGIQMMSQANTYILQMPQPYGFGKSVLDTGLLMTPSAVAVLIVAPLAGKLMLKLGVRFFAVLGSLTAFFGLLLLAKYATSVELWNFIAMTVVVSVGIILMNVSLINVLIFSVDRRVMGVATGANSLFRNFGATWGPAIAGTVMATYYTVIHLPVPPYVMQIPTSKAYEVLFSGAAVVFLILAVLSLFIKEVLKGGVERSGDAKEESA